MMSSNKGARGVGTNVVTQCGFEMQPFKIWKHLKSGLRLSEGPISNGSILDRSGYSYGANQFKTGPVKIWMIFCLNFKGFF